MSNLCEGSRNSSIPSLPTGLGGEKLLVQGYYSIDSRVVRHRSQLQDTICLVAAYVYSPVI